MTLSRTWPQFDNSSVIIAGDWNVVQDYRVNLIEYPKVSMSDDTRK
jgi:hypothetical protein